MPSYTHNQLLVQIHELIRRHFGLEEFRDLCFKLGVGYDDLAGEGLYAKTRELVTRMDRESRLDDLLAFCTRMRPKAAWPDIAAPVSLDASPTTPNRKLNQIFLSHAHQDSDFAHRLAADLRQHGYDIWIAPDSIRPGEQWVTAINRGLAESGIFLLALTPDAARSRWVSGETDAAIYLERLGSIQFFPLDLKPTPAPPLLATYHWVSFRDDYKTGLEMLLQALQPQKVAQLAQLYQLLQEAMGRGTWATAQKLGAEIAALYPNYRETEAQIVLAQREEAREKQQQAEAKKLYARLQAALAATDWAAALTLASQIETLLPGYRDVPQMAARARQGQRQSQRDALSQTLRRIPAWGWGGGVVMGIVVLALLWQLGGGGNGGQLAATPTPTPTLPAVSQVTPTLTPELTNTPTTEPTTTPTNTPTNQPTTTPTPTPTTTPTNTPTTTPDPNVPPPNPQPGDPWTRPSDGMVMVYVPGGTFLMGSDPAQDPDAASDEFPQHEVTLSPYWLDKTEVTNAMYAACVAAGVCAASSYANDNDYNGAAYPVVGVSWNDADAYCAWAGGQLPTEAQWEYAARGDDGRLYPWGNQFDGALANFCDSNCTLSHRDPNVNDGYALTAPVGSYAPGGDSWIGAADMAGNVWEWVDDWYAAYENTPQTDPSGPESADYKVLRGGSWHDDPRYLRAADRVYYSPTNRDVVIGFRCVVPPGS